jgi:hypothetical protein
MKNIFSALVLLVFMKPFHVQSQSENLSHKDSIQLTKSWKIFKKELILKNLNTLKLLSCKRVSGNCIYTPFSDDCHPFSSPDKLLRLFYKKMFSQNRAVILLNKYNIYVYSSLKDNAMKTKYPTQFQIWFTNKSEPGYQFAFIFKKVKGKFKFAGLDQIP